MLQPRKTNRLLRMRWRTLLSALTLLVLLTWLIAIAIAPWYARKELQKSVESDPAFAGRYDPVYDQPELRQLVREKSYREALLKLSENDSIQLVINLGDSAVQLSIKGVVIHQTDIRKFRRDNIMNKFSAAQEYLLLSRPLKVLSEYATIVKEPIVIRHAPKDTLEAAMNAWKPDTLIQHPAFVELQLEQGMRIILAQDVNKRFKDAWTKIAFYSRLGAYSAAGSFKNFISFSKQVYHPTICIEMPVDDLRAIYRALPENTYVVLKL